MEEENNKKTVKKIQNGVSCGFFLDTIILSIPLEMRANQLCKSKAFSV